MRKSIYTGGTLKTCPHCSSDKIWRVQRSEAEKILNYLSNDAYAIKKYLCNACGYSTLINKAAEPFVSKEPLEKGRFLPFVTCKKCGAGKLRMRNSKPGEEAEYRNQTGKTLFKKIVCADCDNRIIISKEDFELNNMKELES